MRGYNFHAPKQLNLDLWEPGRLYHTPLSAPARFALCSKHKEQVRQELFPLQELPWVVKQLEKSKHFNQTHFWISQATLRPAAKTRRVSSIMLLNAAWVDVDLMHPPPGFDATAPSGQVDSLARLLVEMITDAGLPAPSYVVATGGGLCPKWVFSKAVPSAARARWQALQQAILSKVAGISWRSSGQLMRWPVDSRASDPARVLRLVGSVNPRWGTRCEIVWQSPIPDFDFDDLADQVLGYTRQQVQAWKIEKEVWQGWDKNRSLAAAVGLGQRAWSPTASMSAEAARALWVGRFEWGRALLQARGGAQEGQRNDVWWPLANALAWSCGGEGELFKELTGLHQDFFKGAGWKWQEAQAAAASVASRLKVGELYKMKTQTFVQALGASQAEVAALAEQGYSLAAGGSHNAKRDEWDLGVMGFEQMQGLSFQEYQAETKRRQAEAGRRSAELRAAGSAELRVRAVKMRAEGLSLRAISKELDVSKDTISRWTS